MALKYLEDYITGQPVLVIPKPVTVTSFQWLLDYLTGQLSLVLVKTTTEASSGGWGLLLTLRNTE